MDSNVIHSEEVENISPRMCATQMIINPDRFKDDGKKERRDNLFKLSKKGSKTNLKGKINPDLMALIRKKVGTETSGDSFKTLEK